MGTFGINRSLLNTYKSELEATAIQWNGDNGYTLGLIKELAEKTNSEVRYDKETKTLFAQDLNDENETKVNEEDYLYEINGDLFLATKESFEAMFKPIIKAKKLKIK